VCVRFLLAVSHLQYKADEQTQPAEAAIGAGQHYGLATHLIDFTLDPLVATFFAADSEQTNLGPEAAVYWLPLYHAYELGAKVVIPPYWVERLYQQHGCFVDGYQLPGGIKLKDECFSIQFPRDRSYCSSEFGNVDSRLYPESLWLQKAVHWAQDAAERSGLPNVRHADAETLAADLVRFAGEPDFIVGSLDFSNAVKQLSLLVDLVEWLSLSLNESNGEPKLNMDCQVVNALAQQNPGVFAAVRAIGKDLPGLVGTEQNQFSKYLYAMVRCLEHADNTTGQGETPRSGA
jgi:hypothetical protein